MPGRHAVNQADAWRRQEARDSLRREASPASRVPGGPRTADPGKEEAMSRKQRISYLPVEAMDEEMQAELERCRREGTPRPESSAVRAHVPACFWAFARSWETIFRDGVCDHAIKELCRVYVSRTVKCEYCGNQRSEQPDPDRLHRAAISL